MQTTLTQYQESERTQTTRFDQLHYEVTEQSKVQQTTFAEAQAERGSAWQEHFTNVQAELNQLKETYDQHMALAAPVEYWESKRKRHGRWTIGSFIAVVASMLVLGYFLHSELRSVGKSFDERKAAETLVASMKSPTEKTKGGSTSLSGATALSAEAPLTSAIQSTVQTSIAWHFGSFLLLATLSFWLIRLLVRIFLSNMHLENDAAERVTMAKTYLALLRNDNVPKGDGINTVLAALFRPTGDGIVKDEGIPPSTFEWLTKLGGR
jgi:hypothetical protein